MALLSGRDDHLRCARIGCVAECVIRIEDFVEGEPGVISRVGSIPDVGDDAAGGNYILAKQEGSGDIDRFDRRIDTFTIGKCFHFVGNFPARAVDRLRSAECFGDLKAFVVDVDHDEFGGRIELRCQQGGEADRFRSDDRDG